MRIVVVLFVCILPVAMCVLIDHHFIVEYFRFKSLKYLNVYTCGPTKKLVNDFRQFANAMPQIALSVKSTSENMSREMWPLEQNQHIGILIDMDCDNLTSFDRDTASLRLFDYNHHFLLLETGASRLDYDSLNARLRLDVNSDVKYAIRIENGDDGSSGGGNSSQWLIYDLYKTSARHNAMLNVSYYGVYNAGKRRNINNTRTTSMDIVGLDRRMYEQRRNFSRIAFRTFTVIPDNVFWNGTVAEHIFSDEHTDINSFNRVGALLTTYAADYYNFTMLLWRTNTWGYLAPNGTWDGVVRGLQDDVIDFGASPLFQIRERFAIVDYGRMVWGLASAFIFRHPKHKTSFEVFLRPLDDKVWIMIAVAGVVIVLVMRIAVRFEVLTQQRRHVPNDDGQQVDATWSALALFVIGALCQQGAAALPVFIAGRIVTIFVFVFTILLYQFYSGSIVSFLLMQPPRTIRNIEGLAASDVKIGCEDIVYNRVFLGDLLKLKEYKRLGEKPYKKGQPFFISPEEGLKYVARGQYAFHVELSTAYPIIAKTFTERQVCDLEEIPFFASKGVHANFPKRSPYREMFNYMLQKIAQSGLLKRQRIHYHSPKPECIGSQTFTSPVGIDEFYPAMVILTFGVLFSLIALIVEHLLAYKARHDGRLLAACFKKSR